MILWRAALVVATVAGGLILLSAVTHWGGAGMFLGRCLCL